MANEATVTPVINNRESLIQVQLPAKPGKNGMANGPVLQLIPGLNFLDTVQWTEAKKNPTCAALLTTKIAPSRAPEQNPERVGQPLLVERAPVSKDNPLSSVDGAVAVAMIDEMFDVPTMRRFADQETRPQVAAALKEQIGRIEKPQDVRKPKRP